MWRSIRLTLVFWLWWLWTLIGKMALLVTIKTGDLDNVQCLWLPGRGVIDSRGWSGAFLQLSASMSLILLLFLFLSLLRGLRAIGTLRGWGIQFLRLLQFFDSWLLYWLALGTSFGRWRPPSPEAVLVSFASIEVGPETVLASASTAFLTNFLKLLSSQLCCSISTLIEGQRLS